MWVPTAQRYTSNQIFVMLQTYNEQDIDPHILFVNFKQAFDTVIGSNVSAAVEELELRT